MARNIAVGIGIMDFPFQTADGFWRWIDLCEAGALEAAIKRTARIGTGWQPGAETPASVGEIIAGIAAR